MQTDLNNFSDNENSIEFSRESSVFVKRFKTEARQIEMKIRKPALNTDIIDYYHRVMDKIVDKLKFGVDKKNKIGIVITNSASCKPPLALSFRFCHQLSADTLWGLIFRATQSNADFLLEGHLSIKAHIVDIPNGSGRERNKMFQINEFCKRSRGVITISNNDTKCLAYALVVGLHLHRGTPNINLLQDDRLRMEEEANELCELAGNTLETGGSYEDLEIFQDVMPPGIQIVVHQDLTGRNIFYKRLMNDVEFRINLLLHNNHYNVISSTTAAFCTSYYCAECNIPFQRNGVHKCDSACPMCNSKPPCPKQDNFYKKCEFCNRYFKSLHCYEQHLVNIDSEAKTICQMYIKCKNCYRTYKNYKGRKVHTCGEFFCKVCKDHFSSPHLCFMKKDKKTNPPSAEKIMFVYWDTETSQDTLINEQNVQNGTRHIVNLLVSQSQCNNCSDVTDVNHVCQLCGDRQQIFVNDPIKSFLDFLALPRKAFKKIICIAHNSRAFDTQFILNYVMKAMSVKPVVIMRGAQIISMEIGHVKFIDSLSFLTMSLAKLPKTLGLGAEIKKGYFPHLFNTIENQCYVGEIPELSFYDPDGLSDSERSKLIDWHTEQKKLKKEFDFKKEILEYCVSDVSILRQACTKFRDLLIDIGNIDPLTECITLANCSSLIFRRNFLSDNLLGIIPTKGYRMGNQQSQMSIKWLLTEELRLGCKIIHAGNGREVRLQSGELVDGYAELEGVKHVWEYQGCVWHGCKSCYPNNEISLFNDPSDNMQLRRERTESKMRALNDMGYEVHSIYQCVFDKQIKSDENLKNFISNHPLLAEEPLNPRDALYGGRCNGLTLFHECQEGEEIHYKDFMSLYPDRCKYFKIPIGHPTVHTGPEFPDIATTNGIIKCRVLPPRNLFHPVLPLRYHGKLIFTLCHSCAETMEVGDCPHNDEQDRILNGTWVIDELRLAVEKGYVVKSISEIWEYEVSQYDRETKKGGVFAQYIDVFLKIKQEASGWPEWCKTEAHRSKYINDFFTAEGILLDHSKINKNPGLRYVAKALLNCLWGRYAMNVNRNQTDIVKCAKDFYYIMCNPNYDVKNLIFVGEESVIVNYEIDSDLQVPNPTVNVVIASYVTAAARIKLYGKMDILKESCLYSDTDSVVVLYKKGQERLATGDNLGELTDELAEYGAGCYISVFLTAGPKNYAMVIVNRDGIIIKVIMKVRGITLNYKNCQVVNIETLKRIITENNDEVVVVNNVRKIQRTKTHEVVSKPQSKIYRMVYDKRRRVPNSYKTLPYGFKE